MYKSQSYEGALASFQWASVFGFFTHSYEEQYVLLKNLASGWEKYLLMHNKSDLTMLYTGLTKHKRYEIKEWRDKC